MSGNDLELINVINVDLDKQSFRVHRNAYKSQEIFEREQKQIFEKVWLYIGHGSELGKNGDYKTRRVGGRDLIFMRDKQGGVVVFYNSCSHRGAKLCRETSGNTRNIVCPYHGWVFNTEGKLLSLKNETGFSEDLNKDCHLDLQKVARLEQYQNYYFVNFNPKAISLYDYLAGARDVLDAISEQADADDEMIILPGEQSYTVRANYKYMAENSYDGYHVESTHASYLDFLRDSAKGTPAEAQFDSIMSNYATQGQVRGLGNGHAVLESFVPSGRAVAQWNPSMGAKFKEPIEAKKRALVERFGQERADYIAETQKNLVIFPNLVINDIMAVTVRTVEPEGPKFMRINSWALGPAEENEELRAARLDAYVSFLGPAGFGSPDDIEMLELCQQGIEHTPNEWNEISKGAFTDGDARTLVGGPQDEVQLRAYWTQWDRLMSGLDSLEEED